MGRKKKYIKMFGSFTEPFNCQRIRSAEYSSSFSYVAKWPWKVTVSSAAWEHPACGWWLKFDSAPTYQWMSKVDGHLC